MSRAMNHNNAAGILVYIEADQWGNVAAVSRQLTAAADRLARLCGQPLYGVYVGKSVQQLEQKLAEFPFDTVYLIETDQLFQPDCWETAVAVSIDELHPAIVLIGGTNEGRAFAPRLAVRYRTGLTADCTELAIDEAGCLIQTRPAFGGNVMASILTKQARPQMATVRPGVLGGEWMVSQQAVQFVHKVLEDPDSHIRVIHVEADIPDHKLSGYQTLIVGGRGIRQKEDLAMLYELAKLCNGGFAASRALVERGWVDPACQIGISGNTVNPDWLITCGVSGSVQFISGMKTSKNIIAINHDPEAEILKLAHYPICADLYETIPRLIEKLKKECGRSPD